jgi:hypothetical protein
MVHVNVLNVLLTSDLLVRFLQMGTFHFDVEIYIASCVVRAEQIEVW